MSGQLANGHIIRDQFEIVEFLSESSLGEVYLAKDQSSGNLVQLEVISDADGEIVARLSAQIELLAGMQHPNIVKVLDAGQDGDTFFVAGEYEPGKTLQALITDGPLSEEQALSVARDIATGLKEAWKKDRVMHRDIKPGVIFVTDSGKAKIMGFGIAKSSKQSMGLTGVGFTIGTPEYMSPEQIRAEGELDFHTDMYALGCITYEMLTGKLPFEETVPILLMQKHMDEMPTPVDQVNNYLSGSTANMIEALMQKDPQDRPANWDVAIAQIDEILSMDLGAEDSEETGSEDFTDEEFFEEEALDNEAASDEASNEEGSEAQKQKSGCALSIVAFCVGSIYVLVKLFV
ncbi:MAG: serine/threonine protein kinase [Lentisphaeria bacterium]|nr:serine/threonine protein kinase [Lentisphaeria bacterium]